MSVEKSAELVLAEAVAEQTAQRMREGFREELDARDSQMRQLWQQDLGKLRDDLTAKRLLEDLKTASVPPVDDMPVRVLVVDDYPEIRKAFIKIFTNYGMLVRDAADGTEAASILENDPMIEVVVADISMPKNGYTLLEHIRKTYPILEVIMTSGLDAESERARQLGAFAFLPKPFNMGQAVLIVERAAEFRRLKLAKTSQG